MNCPHCVVELRITDRQGIEIDYCPKCRGVWLDRGELDKIVERANTTQFNIDDDHDDDDARASGRREAIHPPGRRGGQRRESFWSDLFDFG